MAEALQEARIALRKTEVPVGAVLFFEGNLVGRGHNSSISNKDATAHAEIQAIRDACKNVGNYRLPNSILYVTLEPCIMCAGAILQARIEEVVFAIREPICGASGSVINVLESDWMNHRCRVTTGICADESRVMLKEFFSKLRSGRVSDESRTLFFADNEQ